MAVTRVLTQSEVRRCLEMAEAVPAVEAAFAAHGRGETQMPVKVYLDLVKYDGDFRAMPAYLDGSAGVKWVNAHPHNPERHGLPSVLGMYILSDPKTALPLAVMDATYLTAARTGAAAAVAARHLAREPERIGFIGCGVQARTMLAALRVVYSGDFEVLAADRSDIAAQRFAAEVHGRAVTLEEAAGCDIVCTATPSRQPVVRRDWIRPGTHINAMGADAHGKQELEAAILLDAKVVVDDWEQAGESGEVNVPLDQGVLEPDQIHATLGAICAGNKEGRASREEITVFDSTGLAVQDVALARLVYERAAADDVGREVDFSQ
ncbi:MAG: ornithine cyclodeaminase family protein [Acidobacteria bacterium]|nr:MAG: ornithine cyclodeaminase family protein [Acidobacteriota bacterium]REK07943.1 MAG: ornithine cyclodeaminase family protein [Acidobacteriota bacterium]